ncbi:acyltransferase family protein [Rhizosphaericola mali]|uniref:Acyltransferase n=1 Tax=Rhizosphaericola mali TaxID=2545455 RepID=A0A5P2GC95_9BACT|nr:acyltransferase [Rhizosphaericola mali]QES89191.1 acyltransferase [Rhizosphaericola mali]
MKEIKSLTGLRGLAAVYVMIGHIGFLENKNGICYKIKPIRLFIDHGYISVDIFFILSGFVLMLVYGNTKWNRSYNIFTFIKKRIARIYPLYLFCFLIYFLIDYIFINSWFVGNGNLGFIFNLLLLQTPFNIAPLIGPSWSLSTEWIAYFLFPVLNIVVIKIKNEYLQFFISLGLVTCLFLIGISPGWVGHKNILHCSINVFSGIPALFRCIIGFYIGMLLCKLRIKLKNNKIVSCSCFQIVITATILLLIMFTYMDIFVFMLLIILIFSLSYENGLISKLLSHKILYNLGLFSYSIYLIHPLLIGELKDVIYYSLKKTSLSNNAFIISLTICLFLVIFYINILNCPQRRGF